MYKRPSHVWTEPFMPFSCPPSCIFLCTHVLVLSTQQNQHQPAHIKNCVPFTTNTMPTLYNLNIPPDISYVWLSQTINGMVSRAWEDMEIYPLGYNDKVIGEYFEKMIGYQTQLPKIHFKNKLLTQEQTAQRLRSQSLLCWRGSWEA